MKHLINDPENVVNESLKGLCTDPSLTLLDSFPEIRVVCRREWDKQQVAVISGGGSGHEPAHAGFVGQGMLNTAVCGNIFASPSVDAVLSAIVSVSGDKGCLLVVKNYTGDRLNFGLAAEQARDLGIDVEIVIVGDDVALGNDVEQRGIAGTLFVHKVAGYFASQDASLAEVKKKAQQAADNTFSIGVALTGVQQFTSTDESRLEEDEAELGLGIHGEPGAAVIDMDTADNFMQQAVDQLSEYLPEEDTDYAMLLNNLGSVSAIEMNVLQHSYQKTDLAEHTVLAVHAGQLMTSLNMKGFSVSLLELDDELKKALVAPASPPAWNISPYGPSDLLQAPELPDTFPFEASNDEGRQAMLKTAAITLQEMEDELNDLDSKVGDGDAGTTFAMAGKALEKNEDQFPYANIHEFLVTVGRLMAHEIGGSSGVLLSILFTAAGNAYQQNQDMGDAFAAGLDRMKETGGADVGDRTMIDALQPAVEALKKGKSVSEIAQKARKGADKTGSITETSAGRSSYLSEKDLKDVVDPGAEMVARVIEALAADG
jgi:dihydroxyacetone kinase